MDEDGWTKIARVEDCTVGRGRFVAVGEIELAVFRLTEPERFVVTKNSCPHAGGNLAAGEVTGGVVTCPWHQWQFDLDSGSCPLSESVRLGKFETRVADGFVWARL